MSMEIRRRAVGTSRGHDEQGPRPVEVFTLDNGTGLAIDVSTYGAHLLACRVPDGDGCAADVVLGLPDLGVYERRADNPYVGATVGRYAFRIADARFELDGRTHELAANDGTHCLHGGTIGFDRYVWAPTIETAADHCALRLGVEIRDGAEGFPGALRVETVFRVDDRQQLTFEHTVTTDAPTIVNMTNHAYWNLAGAGTVGDHLLQLNAATYLPADTEVIPTGPPAPVAGTLYDFTVARGVGPGGLDTLYPLTDPDWAAVLHDPRSRRTMTVRTDQPGVNVYTADKFRPPLAGICLETGNWPDAPNRPDFPSPVLRPGETYRHRTVHTFAIA